MALNTQKVAFKKMKTFPCKKIKYTRKLKIKMVIPMRRRCQKISRMVVLGINTPWTLMKRNMNGLEDMARPHHRIGKS